MLKMICCAAAGLAAVMLCGCTEVKTDEDRFPITFMTCAAVGDSIKDDSPVKAKVEELTDTKIDLMFVPAESYSENLNITLASGDMPMVLYINENTPNVLNAIRRGDFWDVTDYLKDYEHLSKADPEILKKISVDGRTYGIYRWRDPGRFGYAYRKDWLDNLGLKEPETMEDFYNMLWEFTYNDPDGNGIDDTYGMTVTSSDITFTNLAVWNGAPNGWGFDADGNLIPMQLTDEYFDALKLFKKMINEKLINADYSIMDSANWNIPFIEGESGVILDTCDRANPLYEKVRKKYPATEVGVAGVINNRVRPYLGYSGYFAFPKDSIKDEKTLRRVLQFMDDCCDKEVADLMGYGIEGTYYELVDGYARRNTGDDVPRNKLNDFNQCLTYIDTDDHLKPEETELQKKINQVMKDNVKYSVANPAECLISPTYEEKSTELNEIIKAANIKYVSGELDDAGYQEELKHWKAEGGDAVIQEINEAYNNK